MVRAARAAAAEEAVACGLSCGGNGGGGAEAEERIAAAAAAAAAAVVSSQTIRWRARAGRLEEEHRTQMATRSGLRAEAEEARLLLEAAVDQLRREHDKGTEQGQRGKQAAAVQAAREQLQQARADAQQAEEAGAEGRRALQRHEAEMAQARGSEW
tara:strand:+ start:194 stop:661 length:468 start_codon:yes stop_codon:yes gene_type:complete